MAETVTGYLHPAYADSLSEFGATLQLRKSGGRLLQRPIPGSTFTDAMGCYPLFACPDWSGLQDDLEQLRSSLVSVVMVTDPFGEYEPAYLRDCFRDVVRPFKDHFVTELSRPPEAFLNAHHRRNVRRALRQIQVEDCKNPSQFLNDWIGLYHTLVTRHKIIGINAFSSTSFAKQFEVPGLFAFRAVHDGSTVGMLLWYVHGKVSYYHLGAYNEVGYELGASFALFSYSVEYFAERGIEWLNLGAGAGIGSGADSGLGRFKQGWSTGTRTAYFCGRIFDRKTYDELVLERSLASEKYFPAYRAGEFS